MLTTDCSAPSWLFFGCFCCPLLLSLVGRFIAIACPPGGAGGGFPLLLLVAGSSVSVLSLLVVALAGAVCVLLLLVLVLVLVACVPVLGLAAGLVCVPLVLVGGLGGIAEGGADGIVGGNGSTSGCRGGPFEGSLGGSPAVTAPGEPSNGPTSITDPGAPGGPSPGPLPPPPKSKSLKSLSTFFCPAMCCQFFLLMRSQILGLSASPVSTSMFVELICS